MQYMSPEQIRGERVQQYMVDKVYNRIEALTAWAAEREHGLNELSHAWPEIQRRIRL